MPIQLRVWVIKTSSPRIFGAKRIESPNRLTLFGVLGSLAQWGNIRICMQTAERRRRGCRPRPGKKKGVKRKKKFFFLSFSFLIEKKRKEISSSLPFQIIRLRWLLWPKFSFRGDSQRDSKRKNVLFRGRHFSWIRLFADKRIAFFFFKKKSYEARNMCLNCEKMINLKENFFFR